MQFPGSTDYVARTVLCNLQGIVIKENPPDDVNWAHFQCAFKLKAEPTDLEAQYLWPLGKALARSINRVEPSSKDSTEEISGVVYCKFPETEEKVVDGVPAKVLDIGIKTFHGLKIRARRFDNDVWCFDTLVAKLPL